MIKRAAQRIGIVFVENTIIKEEDIKVYTHGLELMISELVSSILVMAIGMMMGKPVEAVLYLITFTCIRVYAGGYHAGSYKTCTIIFCVCAYLVFMMTGYMCRIKALDCFIVLLLIADIVIFLLAPVEDPNKKLDRQECRNYKYISRKEAVVFSIIFLTFFYFVPSWKDEISYCIAAMCEIAVLLIAGYIKNRILIDSKQ